MTLPPCRLSAALHKRCPITMLQTAFASNKCIHSNTEPLLKPHSKLCAAQLESMLLCRSVLSCSLFARAFWHNLVHQECQNANTYMKPLIHHQIWRCSRQFTCLEREMLHRLDTKPGLLLLVRMGLQVSQPMQMPIDPDPRQRQIAARPPRSAVLHTSLGRWSHY